MEHKKARAWFWGCLFGVITILIVCAIATVVIDPYFHYHGPIEGVSYRLRQERYTNPGILKNFDYDAAIIGTSMIKNFKTSQMEELFDIVAVKTPIPGARYGDMYELMEISFARENPPSLVLLSFDLDRLVDPYTHRNNETVPYYLYDDNYCNDVSYLLNKEILIRDVFADIIRTIKQSKTMSLDEYSSFEEDTGKDVVLSQYVRLEEVCDMAEATDEQKQVAYENVSYNILSFVEQYPDTKFILFFPPYSMIYWDKMYREGQLLAQLDIKEYILGIVLQYENVEVYCFNDKTEWITDLDYYIDDIHYNAEVSESILEYIAEQKHQITNENLREHIEKEELFFKNYPYDNYFID